MPMGGGDSDDYDDDVDGCLQVSADSTSQGHDTLGVIALDSRGNISAGIFIRHCAL